MLGSGAGPAAAAPEPPGRTELVAEALAEEPVQVTDAEARLFDPEALRADIKTALDPLGMPYYVVVEPQNMFFDEYTRPEDLIPILHDRLGEDGLYVVTDTSGGGTAQAFGSALPADDAWRAARRELTYGTPLIEQLVRFTEMLSAPDPVARVSAATRAPEPVYASDERDRVEMTALGVGAVVGALLLGIPLLLNLVLKPRRARRRGPAAQSSAPAPRRPAAAARKGKPAARGKTAVKGKKGRR
ncbi:hypothetical protein [Actinocorallia aurea]